MGEPGRAQHRQGRPAGLRCVHVWYRTCCRARWRAVRRRLVMAAARSVGAEAWIAAAISAREARRSGRASRTVGRNQFSGSRMTPRTWARAAGRAASRVMRVGVPAPVMVLYVSGCRPSSRARRTMEDMAWSRETGSQASSAAPSAAHAGMRSAVRLEATLASSHVHNTCSTV